MHGNQDWEGNIFAKSGKDLIHKTIAKKSQIIPKVLKNSLVISREIISVV